MTAAAPQMPRIVYHHEEVVVATHPAREYLVRIERDPFGPPRRITGTQPGFSVDVVVRTKSRWDPGMITHSLAYAGGVPPLKAKALPSIFERWA